MKAAGLRQQGSQAVDSGFESLPCQNFYDLSLNFSMLEISETLRGSPRKIFGTVRPKIFDGKS